ncbi:MAG: hypothetical protein R3242_02990, partial [Akkermansiaceae bacterium]|nr:hypothetical protein [Akkermansiaceae bacterium]
WPWQDREFLRLAHENHEISGLARKFHETSVCGLSFPILPAFSLKRQLDRVSTQPCLRFQRRPWQDREFLRLAHENHEISGLIA